MDRDQRQDTCHTSNLPAVIVVGGEALVDLVIDPQGNVAAKLGGGPFNAARAAARLGSEVAFLGSLSRDRFGRSLHDQLVADGVSDAMVSFTELPTTLAAAELDAGGSATYRFYLKDIARRAEHTLSDSEERLLADAGPLAGSPSNIYGILSNADFPYPTITLKDGTTAKVDQAG